METYLHIINVRFSGEIHYMKTVTGSIDRIAIPGVILQPIVENAINHGLRDVKWEKHIELTTREEGDKIRVTIFDNGKGMTQPEIEAILQGEPMLIEMEGQPHRGTGLKNVIERLRIYYGVQDVFEITSEGPGKEPASASFCQNQTDMPFANTQPVRLRLEASTG